MRSYLGICVLVLAAGITAAEEPDGLKLPPGFHASVVTEGLGPIRHLAVRSNGDLYVSTAVDKQNKGGGIIALHLDANHKADRIEHFGTVEGGTGIRFHDGALYATSASGVYRFRFAGDELLPEKDPDLIVDGMPTEHPGFNRVNRALAFDGKGNLYVALDASGNLCTGAEFPPGAPPAGSRPNVPAKPPVGLKPCPDLGRRAGMWRFDASKLDQKFPNGGEQIATGIRDSTSLDWSPADGHLYVILQGRDNTNKFWPQLVSEQADDQIADEMHRVSKGSDFGWPYTYYDGVRKVRLVSPEYGGDGNKTPPAGKYSTPVLTFQSRRSSPADLMFYTGNEFPASYRNGAFIVLHGTRNANGYDVVFVPFNHEGVAGAPTVFADGFADFAASKGPRPQPKYRPIGIAMGPDGSLYVADSQKGKIWRIVYGSN
jgi:glucose/arabinose dehydrogenase